MQTAELRFLADESCAVSVIQALREDGHNVYALSEVTRRTVDTDVLEQAAAERRILLTEDKDFGELVFVTRAESAGVLLMRFPQGTRSTLVPSVQRAVQLHGDALVGAFTVVQPGVVRISRRPSPDNPSSP